NRHDGDLAWMDQTRSKGLLAVDLLGFERPEAAALHAVRELRGGGFGGCNYLIAAPDAAFLIQAPGASRVAAGPLAPGIHAMTNLDADDDADPRIRLVAANLNPADFRDSAVRICRDPRIIVEGAERGTVSSSLIAIGEDVVFEHILGDPRANAYLHF